MNIKEITENLINKYRTSDPFELADELNIKIRYLPLGNINGFYIKVDNYKFININTRLDSRKRTLTAAHELGHVVMHPDVNTPFMREHTYFSINKYEIEANRFTAHLLIPDRELLEYCEMGYTTYQIANCYGFPSELIELRMQDFR